MLAISYAELGGGGVGGDAPGFVAGEELGRDVRCTPNRRHLVALPQPTRCANTRLTQRSK